MFDIVFFYYKSLIETPFNTYKIGFWFYSDIIFFKLNYFKNILYFNNCLNKINFKLIKSISYDYSIFLFKSFTKLFLIVFIIILI